jgi:SAM-dependent methyltransferase
VRQIGLRIDAVDAAAIDPAKVADPARLAADIRFHGGVRLEALPFAVASFDAIVSQFGFEYADEDQAVAEVARVAAPGARLSFVMHAQDGGVSRDISRRLDRLRAVLHERGPVTLVRTLARALEAGDSATVARESVHLRDAANVTRDLAKDPPADDAALFYASEFLRSWSLRERYKASDLRRSIEEGWANADGVATRQDEMLRVARTRDGVIALAAKFASQGFSTTQQHELHDQRRGVQFAWLWTAQKTRA